MAEKSKTQLRADLPVHYSDNYAGQISPGDQRSQQTDIIDSFTLQSDALALFTLAAYGGVHYNGAELSIGTIGSGWTDIDIANTNSVAAPRFIDTDLTDGTVSYQYPGVYLLSLTFAISHNSSNDGRVTNIRLYNVTAGAAIGDGIQVGIGRNVEATSLSVTMIAEIPESALGDEMFCQIGGGDTLTGCYVSSYAMETHSVGEFRGTLPSETAAADYEMELLIALVMHLRGLRIPAKVRGRSLKTKNILITITDILAAVFPPGLPSQTAAAITAWLATVDP